MQTKRPRLPRNVWVLGFVSLLMDLSSEIYHSLLPAFITIVLGLPATALGAIDGIAGERFETDQKKTVFVRVRFLDEDGTRRVVSAGAQHSNVLSAMAVDAHIYFVDFDLVILDLLKKTLSRKIKSFNWRLLQIASPF